MEKNVLGALETLPGGNANSESIDVMVKQLSLAEFLSASAAVPVIDVRTPAEFEQGHIIGANNLPLFSNEERVKVGTIYKQVGREAAILLGFELTGPKWAEFIRQAEKMAPDKKILVHCWRGGMRSGAMAWALDLYGFNTGVLKNGYKAYRSAGIESFTAEYPFRVLGGLTGTGKTKILQAMKDQGEQVIDLEELAQHQGSAFGSLGRLKQPSQEQFENLLAAALRKMEPGRQIWIEDESVSIGKRIIPKNIFQQMSRAPLICLELPLEERLLFLTDAYGSLDKTFLKESVIRIAKRLGSLSARYAVEAIEDGRIRDFIARVLVYYDKAYNKGQMDRPAYTIHSLTLENSDAEANAGKVIDFWSREEKTRVSMGNQEENKQKANSLK